jgi:uncharacterized membrane protein required for colicin V production
MNVVDLILIGSMGLLVLTGLKVGIIKPASGVGGIVLGFMIGLNYQAQIASLLAPHISGDVLPRLASLVIAIALTFANVKVLAVAVTMLRPEFKKGIVDHLAGAGSGIAVGLLVMGTMSQLLSGINVAPTREVLNSSRLAPIVTKASLVSPSIPWCSSVNSEFGLPCHSYSNLLKGSTGFDIRAEMEGILSEGQDVDSIMSLVKGTLNGKSPKDMTQISNTP